MYYYCDQLKYTRLEERPCLLHTTIIQEEVELNYRNNV